MTRVGFESENPERSDIELANGSLFDHLCEGGEFRKSDPQPRFWTLEYDEPHAVSPKAVEQRHLVLEKGRMMTIRNRQALVKPE